MPEDDSLPEGDSLDEKNCCKAGKCGTGDCQCFLKKKEE